VGALLAAIAGAALLCLVIHGFAIPGRHATHLRAALEAVPTSLIGLAVSYAVGVYTDTRHPRRA
jgi:hypothetical protein